jgi:hypothetical protein
LQLLPTRRYGIVRAQMPSAFPIRWQWQWERRIDTTRKRLAVALVASLLLHAVAFTGWVVSPTLSSYARRIVEALLPRKFETMKPTLAPPAEPRAKREVPLVFVEVDPAQAAPQPPKETRNYSTHNSIAANEQPKNLEVPKIDGTQTRVIRTVDNPRPQPKPLQPAPTPTPEPKLPDKSETEEKPKAAPPIGDLTMTKAPPVAAEPKPVESEASAVKPREKPRTLREAMLRNPALAGAKTQQEGGVQRRAHVAMVDAKGSPFGNYDNVFIAIVQERWFNLLENNRFMMDRRGKVVLTFRLHYDGRITQLETGENSVGDLLGLLCQKAILDPAPFPKWPTEMRQRVEVDYRDVRFTFYYD